MIDLLFNSLSVLIMHVFMFLHNEHPLDMALPQYGRGEGQSASVGTTVVLTMDDRNMAEVSAMSY